MSSPHLYLPNNPSIIYMTRPTLVVLPKSPQKDNIRGDQGEEEEQGEKNMELQSEVNHTLPLSSSSSSSPSQNYDESNIREDEVNKKETTATTTTTTINEADEDDGYQTPTSPRNRIPPLLKCPKAPMKRKPSCRRRVTKRSRVFWGCFEIVSVVEIGDEPGRPAKMKKARSEAAIAN